MKERKILIIEDEPRAVNRLERLLKEVRPEWQILGVSDTVDGAVALFKKHPDADAAFLDIQLADGLSFEALELAKPEFPVVFVTAYDHYAVKAFEHFSLDFLLKPAGEDGLKRAIEKIERTLSGNDATNVPNNLQEVLTFMQQASKSYKQRFLSKVGDKLRFFEASEIRCFFSENKQTYLLHVSGRKYPLDQTLEEITNEVDPAVFFRINRQFLVAAKAISEMYAHSNSRLRLVIPDMEDEVIVVARERVNDFKTWLDR